MTQPVTAAPAWVKLALCCCKFSPSLLSLRKENFAGKKHHLKAAELLLIGGFLLWNFYLQSQIEKTPPFSVTRGNKSRWHHGSHQNSWICRVAILTLFGRYSERAPVAVAVDPWGPTNTGVQMEGLRDNTEHISPLLTPHSSRHNPCICQFYTNYFKLPPRVQIPVWRNHAWTLYSDNSTSVD